MNKLNIILRGIVKDNPTFVLVLGMCPTLGTTTSAMNGMGMGDMAEEGETLILNANHPLVQYVVEHQDGDNVKMICEQLYDLALLQQGPLEPEAMTKFVARSNDIMMLLTR